MLTVIRGLMRTGFASLAQFIFCGIFGAAINSNAVAQELTESEVLLQNVRVIVGDGSVLENAAVLLRGSSIQAVGNANELDFAPDVLRIDLSGKTLMPTLIDAHAHVGYEGYTSWGAENYSVGNLLDHLERYAFYGFGAVFSAGSDSVQLVTQVQLLLERGEATGARLLIAAGMAPPGQGPNNQFLAEVQEVAEQTGDTILYGLAAQELAQEAVIDAAALQYRFIKLWVDDRGGTQTKLEPPLYRAVMDEAERHGMAVVVHQQSANDMPDLIAAGTRGFLHGRLENGFTPAIAAAAAANNVFIVPNLGLAELRREAIGEDEFLAQTLPEATVQRLSVSTQRQAIPDRNAQLEQTLQDSFALLLAAGVDVVLGTDAGAVPDHPFGYTGHRELEIFVRHGMSPMQAISAGTAVAARVLGLEDTGMVKPGYRADLLVLDANPLEDIRNTRAIFRIYLGGQQIDRAALAQQFTLRAKGN